jgi:hypothetical protein
MSKHLEISITAVIPADNEELGHEAVVATKDTVAAVVTALVALGLHAEQSRRLVTRRPTPTKIPVSE